MAETDDIKEQEGQEEQEEQKDPKAEKSDKKSLIARFLPWIIIFVVVLICAGAGLSVGRLFAGSRTPEADESGASAQTEDLKANNDSSEGSGKVWYYDLDPVVANLNEPSVTRYVRASLTLEMSSDMDVKKGTAFLDEKKPILVNWLNVYLSSLGLEDIRGDKNLRSIQSHIHDAFNEKLFPDSKPQIKQVLIKEFPVQ